MHHSASPLRSSDACLDRRQHLFPSGDPAHHSAVDIRDFTVQQRAPTVEYQAQDYGPKLLVAHFFVR
jgi:hypothetical protein